MEIAILSLLSLITSYISCGIINCKRVKEENSIFQKAISALPNKKFEIFYCILMFICLEALSLLFVLVYKNNIFESIKLICLSSLLFPMAYIDYKQYRIPNKLVLLGLGYRIFILIFELIFFNYSNVISSLISEGIALAVVTLFLGICTLVFRGGIGMGDLKFLMMMALLHGFNRLLISLMVVMIFAFFFALYLIIFKKKGKKDSFCFGPIIASGTLVSLIFFGI